jgi:hypothetical protein
VSPKPDPRIAGTTVIGGAPDLIGHDLVVIDECHVKGELLHIPRLLAGVPEFVAVAEAEVKAEELRGELLSTLTDTGRAKWQKNTTLVVEMRAAAETAVVTAVVGLEAFSSHHVARLAAETPDGTVIIEGKPLRPEEVREKYLDDRYKNVLPALFGVHTPAGKKWWQVFRRVQALSALTRHAIYEPIERSGLSGKRSLPERFYLGEYQGVARMMFSAFEHFSPGWISDERLRTIGEGRTSLSQALEGYSTNRES